MTSKKFLSLHGNASIICIEEFDFHKSAFSAASINQFEISLVTTPYQWRFLDLLCIFVWFRCKKCDFLQLTYTLSTLVILNLKLNERMLKHVICAPFVLHKEVDVFCHIKWKLPLFSTFSTFFNEVCSAKFNLIFIKNVKIIKFTENFISSQSCISKNFIFRNMHSWRTSKYLNVSQYQLSVS